MVIRITKDIITDSHVSRKSNIGLTNSVGLRPVAELSNTDSYEKTERFLNIISKQEKKTGFELMYTNDEDRLSMNLLYSDDIVLSEATQDIPAKVEQASYDNLPSLTTDKYISGLEVSFSNDYWYQLENDREILNELLAAIVRCDTNVTMQVTLDPIKPELWKQRWSLKYYTYQIITDILKRVSIPIMTGLKSMAKRDDDGYGFSSFVKSSVIQGKNLFKDMYNRYDGYTFNDLIWSHEKSGDEEDEELDNEIRDVIESLKEKRKEDGVFICELRIISVGDNKSTVEDSINSLESFFNNQYTEPNNPAVRQGLNADVLKTKSELNNLITKVESRETGIDHHGYVRDWSPLKLVKSRRSSPMVITPESVCTVFHIPPDNLSISGFEDRDIEQAGGEAPDNIQSN